MRIDVTDDASVARAAADIEAHEGRIDVLINNAGILGSHAPAEALAGPDAIEILDTNVAGIVRVTHAFLPLLRRSEHPAVINVCSGMGSFALTHDPDRVESKPVAPLYTASKAAVTMLTTQYAKGAARCQGQRRRSRLHRHRLQRPLRPPDDHRRAPTRSWRWPPRRPAPAGSSIASARSAGSHAQSSRITMPVMPFSTAATPARTARAVRSGVNVAGS